METINIISESFKKNITGGPNKVISNTLKGLDLIGYPYVLNKDVHDFKNNWVHDSIKGFIEVTNSKIPSVIGPNIFTLPKDIPAFIPKSYNSIYLHPSDWCVDVWKQLGYKRSLLASWPAGIDTYYFKPSNNRSAKHVLIYFKKREQELLNIAEKLVIQFGLTPLIIKYGSYNEEEYKKALAIASFGIWIGCSESQGIGLQEALATNLPLIVCNAHSLLESTQTQYQFPQYVKAFRATTVPYFDERCGIVIDDITDLEGAIKKMISNNLFAPRDFILENLTLEQQARQLISFFDGLERSNYSKGPSTINAKHKPFKLSSANHLTYLFHIFKRKSRTLFRLLKKTVLNH